MLRIKSGRSAVAVAAALLLLASSGPSLANGFIQGKMVVNYWSTLVFQGGAWNKKMKGAAVNHECKPQEGDFCDLWVIAGKMSYGPGDCEFAAGDSEGSSVACSSGGAEPQLVEEESTWYACPKRSVVTTSGGLVWIPAECSTDSVEPS